MKATILLALFVTVVGRIMADEAKAWSCWLHKKVRRIAVSKLPPRLKARYDEEWENALAEIPGDISKLIYSIGLLRAAFGIRNAALKSPDDPVAEAVPLKRMFDIAFSASVLILYAPVLLAIAIAIKLNSPGPVFYFSERVGKKGVVFRCAKFRTMVRDAENRRADIKHMNDRDGVLFEVSSDPRITKLGRFLRKYSLDELPQFFNVLKGDMSVVGPRPPIATEVRACKASHMQRLGIAPGITGLWQVKSREDPSFASLISLDEEYAKKISIWLDFKIIWLDFKIIWLDVKIILRTIIAAFRGPTK